MTDEDLALLAEIGEFVLYRGRRYAKFYPPPDQERSASVLAWAGFLNADYLKDERLGYWLTDEGLRRLPDATQSMFILRGDG